MPKKATPTNVYALIIGINDYREDILLAQKVVFPKLSGCINDAQNILQYLQSDASLKVNALELYDRMATKPVIIDAFRTHLAQATNDDVVFLFYSGHGGVEAADTTVWGDPHLECLVCYYDHGHSPDFLLADKELRILLKELHDKTKAHIVTIFDCCHSGDNTRELFAGTPDTKRKQIDFTFPKRQWNEFIFSNQFQAAQFVGKNMNQVIPQAPHIQIAAAERDEAALEVGGHGVLTTYLLKSLKACGGNVTYRDLHSRIRNQVKYLFAQKPKMYAPDQSLKLLEGGFLKKDVRSDVTSANLVYNKKVGWRIDRGILHGVVEGLTSVHIQADGESMTFPVGKTELDGAAVPGVFGLEKKDYIVSLSGLSRQTLRLQLVNKDATKQEVQTVMEQLVAPENAAFIALEDDPGKADYSLVIWRGMYYLTAPDDLFRPLFRPIHYKDPEDDSLKPDASKMLVRVLRHISEWSMIKQLENTGQEVLDKNALQIKFSRILPDGQEVPMSFDTNRTADIEYEPMTGGSKKWGGKIRIEMTNTTKNTKLYAGVLYLDGGFGHTPRLLEPLVAELAPGQSKVVRDHLSGFLRLSFDDVHKWYNRPSFTDSLKFIVSTQPFEVLGLEKKSLPEPLTPETARSIEELEGKKGGIDLDEEESFKPSLSGWNAQTYHLKFHNPEFNKVSQADVTQMLETGEELAHFAVGLYFQHGKTGGLDASLVATETAEEPAEKGFVWNTTLAAANKWAGFWRHRHYKKMAKRFPDKPRFVSEGDSWFQHPLLKDIIDNLGEFYPVYCLAEAGDTIENYLKEGDMFKAFEEINPAGFLLSGGGNDILGESMRGFLSKIFDDAPEGEKPARFFNEAYEKAMENVINNYRIIFNYLRKHRPEMKIYIHGYDYPRPLPTGMKKGWIGKYFDEFGIFRNGDRSHAVHFMMDEFNNRLAALAGEFKGEVEYIDLRQTVADTQWDDEIHPNDDGYREVSLKFVQRIEATMNPQVG